MRLRELEAHFIKRIDAWRCQRVETIDQADGVDFLCPHCFIANDGHVGTHTIRCWRPHVPQNTRPIPGRWELAGTSVDDLTLHGNSIVVIGEETCKAHFFVRDGRVIIIKEQ